MKKREIRKVHINGQEWQYMIKGVLDDHFGESMDDNVPNYVRIILGTPNPKFPGKFNWKQEDINIDEHQYFYYMCDGTFSCYDSNCNLKNCQYDKVHISPVNVKKYIETTKLCKEVKNVHIC